MKVKDFIKYVNDYQDYTIKSDSGWECSATDIDGAFINHQNKTIILVQEVYDGDPYYSRNKNYEILYGGK